jgi:hypothetical protein
MTIVLGLSLIITFIASLGVKVKEGLENMSTDTTDTTSVTGTKPKSATTTPPTTTTPATATTTPATTTTPSTETMNNISGKRNRLDYASTVEDAYDDLSKILGGDGIKRLTGDTQQLLEQQVQLVDAMKTMTPLIETAKGLLNGLNIDGLNGLTDIAQKLMPTNR